MDACSSSPITIENEQMILDCVEELSSTIPEPRSPKDFDYFLNMMRSSSSVFTSLSRIPVGNSQPPADENGARSSPKASSSTIPRTIFVSHLPSTVNNRRLRTWFPGCRKIVFKQNQLNKNLKFALVEHRNCIDAQRNLSAFLASPPSAAIFFGVQASYARENERESKSVSSLLTDLCNVRDLYVGRIPGWVASDQLRTLFPQATSIEYRQGKITRNRAKLGFAFLRFVDIQSAAEVMQHADQYYIGNQSLSISYKVFKNAITTTNNSG